jgi:5-methylthioadenosine/S-adenosylhomocysteine deaminase
MPTFLITDATVITVDEQRRIIKDGAVAIQDDEIVGVGKSSELRARFSGAEVIRASGKIVLPGLIDTHVHLTQTLARGLADQVTVPDWLYERILPYEVAMSEDDVYNSSMLACAEMIRTGTTCFADPGGYQMEHAGKAVKETGMRGVLAIASVDKQDDEHPLPPKILATTEESVSINEKLIKDYNNKADGRIKVFAALRGMLNVTKELIMKLNDLSHKYETGMEVHAAFWRDNVAFVKKTTGLTDVRYLESLGVLDQNWMMIHMGWVDDEEIEILRKRDVKISYCPAPGMKMPLGTNVNKKIPKMIERGVTVSLGCDSTAADNSLDMFRAMWLNSTVHKEMFLDPMLISAEQTLEMATINSAKCLLWEKEIGSIGVGKKADLIIMDAKASNMVPMHDFSIVPNIVYAGEGSNVETVMINGKLVMENREMKLFDYNKVLDSAQKATERIVDKVGYSLNSRWPIS